MKTNGVPVFSDSSITSATLSECTSPAEPPPTVKSWLARWISRPSTVRRAGDHAVGREFLAGHAELGCAVLGEQAELLEAVRIDERARCVRGRSVCRSSCCFASAVGAAALAAAAAFRFWSF